MNSGPQKVKPTAEEIEMAKIASEQWAQYKEIGVPLENEWIRRTTGMTLNTESGEYEIDPSAGVLNDDGSVKTDTTDAASANEQAFGSAMNQIDPNRMQAAEQLSREGSVQGGLAAAEMGLNQQANHYQGLANVVARGKGLEGESLQRQSDLAANAQQDSFSAAEEAATRRGVNAHMVGEIGTLGLVGHSYLDKLTKKKTSAIDHLSKMT